MPEQQENGDNLRQEPREDVDDLIFRSSMEQVRSDR